MATATATQQKNRDRVRKQQAAIRFAEQGIEIPACLKPKRRSAAEKDVFKWLRTYLPALFYTAFSADQRAMVTEILRVARDGGDQCLAAPRASGKSTVALGVLLYALVTGRLRFVVLVAATGPDAKRLLGNLKKEIADNDTLCEDYPELCIPVRELGGAVQRQGSQHVDGERTRMTWGVDQLVLPTVRLPGKKNKLAGAIIMARGLDSAIRGLNIGGRRPDFVLVDDPETRESASSQYQCETREQIVDGDLGGLAAPGKKLGRLMLTTIQNVACLSAKYSDPKKKPSWNGKRYRLLVKLPDREDLWAEYVAQRNDDQAAGDWSAANACQFYADRRVEMDAGAVVSDPGRFNLQFEESALQACYNIIADRGRKVFDAEYQNDPQPEEDVQKLGITTQLIESRLSGMSRGELPPDCKIVIGVDVGRYRCHFTCMAARPGGIGNVVDYGLIEVSSTDAKDTPAEVIEHQILKALLEFRDQLNAHPFRNQAGEPVVPSICLVDSGYSPRAVYELVRRMGEPWRATKGASRFYAGQPTQTRKVGRGWFAEWQPLERVWLYSLDASSWKRDVHSRWMTDPIDAAGRAQHGSLTLFQPAMPRDHGKFARSMLAEEWVSEFVAGKGEVSKWVERSADNHWFDSLALCLAAAEMSECGLFSRATGPVIRKPLSELVKSAKFIRQPTRGSKIRV